MEYDGEEISLPSSLEVNGFNEVVMPEHAEPATPPPAVKTSWKLAVAVIVLALLPLVLPFPLHFISGQWLGPIDDAQWEQCKSFGCSPAGDTERLWALLSLGPSMLFALASILLGVIGLCRSRWHQTSQKSVGWFCVSCALGTLWAVVFGVVLWWAFLLAGTTL